MMLCCKDLLRLWSEKYDKSAFQYCFFLQPLLMQTQRCNYSL